MLQSMGFQKLRHDLATELKVLQTPASTGDTTKLPLWSFFRDRPVSGKAECQHKAKWRLHGLNGHWCLQQDMFGWSSGCWKKAEKNQRRYFADKGPSSQSYGFSSNHVWIWELDHKESWVPKNWCFWAVVLEKTLESPLDIKEIKPVHPKGNQPWIFIGRTDVEAEVPMLWPPDAKSWLIRKIPDGGKDWRQEETGMTEDKDGWMVSLSQRTWVLASSGIWWRTGKFGMLQSTGLQRVGHDGVTEQQLLYRK